MGRQIGLGRQLGQSPRQQGAKPEAVKSPRKGKSVSTATAAAHAQLSGGAEWGQGTAYAAPWPHASFIALSGG